MQKKRKQICEFSENMKIDIKVIKQLRDETQASIADCKKALEESKGNLDEAKERLKQKGIEIAVRREGRATSEGLIESYIHQNGKIGSLVEILCETDFVAKNEIFKNLAHDIAMQIAAMSPKDIDSLLSQEYIKDQTLTIRDLTKQTMAKLGENIVVRRFQRFEI